MKSANKLIPSHQKMFCYLAASYLQHGIPDWSLISAVGELDIAASHGQIDDNRFPHSLLIKSFNF